MNFLELSSTFFNLLYPYWNFLNILNYLELFNLLEPSESFLNLLESSWILLIPYELQPSITSVNIYFGLPKHSPMSSQPSQPQKPHIHIAGKKVRTLVNWPEATPLEAKSTKSTSKSVHTYLRQYIDLVNWLKATPLKKICLHSSSQPSQPSQPLLKATTVIFFGPLHIF